MGEKGKGKIEREWKKEKEETKRKMKTAVRKNSRKSVTWSAVPDAPKLVYVGLRL